MLDCQLFGVHAGWHHLSNVAYHTAATLLLFIALRKMTGATWRSAFVAALFGLHPLHVESVAWVSERKDTLSAIFFFLTLIAYTRYAKAREEYATTGRQNATLGTEERIKEKREGGIESKPVLRGRWSVVWKWYALALLFFALGLMSKPILVTVPLILLLLDFWPLKRWNVSTVRVRMSDSQPLTPLPSTVLALLGEKLPFAALSAASCVITFIAQHHAGAVLDTGTIRIGLRFENAIVSCGKYITDMFWPAELAAYYSYSALSLDAHLVGAFSILIVLSVLAALCLRKCPFVTVGWLWYLIMLVPVIGFVQVGGQSRADRYTYLPLIGLFIAITWLANKFLSRTRSARVLGATLALAILGACTLRTSAQLKYWQNSDLLFRHALAVTSNNALAHLNLGYILAARGRLDEAQDHFAEVVRIRPNYAEGRSNLGLMLAMKGHIEAAIEQYRLALAANPTLVRTRSLLGNALARQGKTAEAKAEYEAALKLDPDHLFALNDLSWMLATDPDPQIRNGARAVELAQRGIRLTESRSPQFFGILAAAYAETGHFDDAVKAAEKAEAMATAAGMNEVAQKNRDLLKLYKNGKPYHEISNH
jgi:tetratricopeptide (TPR) repeat protein